jgi:DNA-binding MarR family transcriptional regulator
MGKTIQPSGVANLRRAVTRLSRRMRAQRSTHALSANKLGVLSYLFHHEGSSPGEIATAERLQPQSLSKLLAELESEGLTTRVRNVNDRRQSVLSLSEAGREMLRQDMKERDRWLSLALSNLTETEGQVLQIAVRIIERLAESTVELGFESQTSLKTDGGADDVLRFLVIDKGYACREP